MIKKYKDLYEEVKQKMPFFIRLNMVLVDAIEAKK